MAVWTAQSWRRKAAQSGDDGLLIVFGPLPDDGVGFEADDEFGGGAFFGADNDRLALQHLEGVDGLGEFGRGGLEIVVDGNGLFLVGGDLDAAGPLLVVLDEGKEFEGLAFDDARPGGGTDAESAAGILEFGGKEVGLAGFAGAEDFGAIGSERHDSAGGGERRAGQDEGGEGEELEREAEGNMDHSGHLQERGITHPYRPDSADSCGRRTEAGVAGESGPAVLSGVAPVEAFAGGGFEVQVVLTGPGGITPVGDADEHMVSKGGTDAGEADSDGRQGQEVDGGVTAEGGGGPLFGELSAGAGDAAQDSDGEGVQSRGVAAGVDGEVDNGDPACAVADGTGVDFGRAAIGGGGGGAVETGGPLTRKAEGGRQADGCAGSPGAGPPRARRGGAAATPRPRQRGGRVKAERHSSACGVSGVRLAL